MFTKKQIELILQLFAQIRFGIGQSEQVKEAEEIVKILSEELNKIQDS